MGSTAYHLIPLPYTSNFGIARVVDIVYREIFWGPKFYC